VLRGFGGPYSAGYRWRDSDEADGPIYQWNDISGSGAVLSRVSLCDDCTESVALPFSFGYYDTSYESLYISSNGILTFGQGNDSYSNQPIPSTQSPLNMIAPFWDDLNPRDGGTIYYQTFDDRVIFQFTNVVGYSGPGAYTFQVVLHQNGKITFYYNALSGTVTSNTIGIQNSTGTDGLGIAYNAIYVHDQMATEISRQPSWISTTVDTLIIAGTQSAEIPLMLSSEGLTGGYYSANVSITHNDPASLNPLAVSCSLYVDGTRRLSAVLDTIDLGRVWQGAVASGSITLSNSGDEPTTISSLSFLNTLFSAADTTPLVVPGYSEVSVGVSFSSLEPGSYQSELIIQSDAEDNPVLQVGAEVVVTAAPEVSADPLSLEFTLSPTDMPADQTAVVTNTGGDTLQFSLSVREQQGAGGVLRNAIVAVPKINYDVIYSKSNYEHSFVAGEVIVGFKQGYTGFANQAIGASVGVTSQKLLTRARRPGSGIRAHTGRQIYLLTLGSEDRTSTLSVIAQLQQDPHVAYAEPNYIVRAIGIPDDADFSSLYGMHNTGQSGGTADADIDAVEAWDNHTGSNSVLLGVIDSGIDYNHEDLAANMWVNPGEIPDNGFDDDNNGFIDDVYGWDFYNNDNDPWDDNSHGTHCAGTIAGVGNNGIGVAGVMWQAQIMALKFLSGGGSGSTAGAISSVDYANAMGVHLTSNSWGGGGYSQGLEDAIAAGGLFIAAAGNSNANNDASAHYPSSYELENVIAVAATDHNDAKASFSSYGATSVDLGAPGVDTYSTIPNNGYGTKSGTSMATPHVSGVAGLVWSLNPSLSPLEVKQILLDNVDPISSMAGITLTGGRVNAQAALAATGPNWISAIQSGSGVLAPGQSDTITVTVDPQSLMAGQYLADVVVASNDPVTPELIIDVTANIGQLNYLDISPDSLAFQQVLAANADTLTAVLSNNGNTETIINTIQSSDPAFRVIETAPLTIAAQTSALMHFVFSPSTAGVYTGQILIESDAIDNPLLTVKLSGAAYDSGQFVLGQDTVLQQVGVADTIGASIALHNPGITPVIYNSSVTYPQQGESWLEILNPSATIQSLSSTTFQMLFDAQGLQPGIYTAVVAFDHNGANLPNPAHLEVILTVQQPAIAHAATLSTSKSVNAISTGRQHKVAGLEVGSNASGIAQGEKFKMLLR